MQNLFLLHQRLVIILVARIRLLWILEVLIQLRRRRHRRSFHPYWIFPRLLASSGDFSLSQLLSPASTCGVDGEDELLQPALELELEALSFTLLNVTKSRQPRISSISS